MTPITITKDNFVQEVLRCQTDALRRAFHLYLGNSVYRYINKIVGGYRLARFNINAHLPQIQVINPFQERDADTALPFQNPRFFCPAGNNQRYVRRCFYIRLSNSDNHQNYNDKS